MAFTRRYGIDRRGYCDDYDDHGDAEEAAKKSYSFAMGSRDTFVVETSRGQRILDEF